MALPEAVSMVAEVSRTTYTAISVASETGIGATIEPSSIAEARTAATKGARVEAVKSSAVKAAGSYPKTTETPAERRRPFDASGETYRGDASQQREGKCSSLDTCLRMAITSPLLRRCHGAEWDLLHAFRQRRREHRRGNSRRKVPIGECRTELRLRRQAPISDHQLAWDQFWSGVDPDLPVHIFFDKGKCTAASAIDLICPHIETIRMFPRTC